MAHPGFHSVELRCSTPGKKYCRMFEFTCLNLLDNHYTLCSQDTHNTGSSKPNSLTTLDTLLFKAEVS